MSTHLRVRRALRTFTVGATVTAVCVACASAVAAAATPAFTWAGTDAAGGGDTSWSDPANWSGDVAPVAGTRVSVRFPALTCSSTCPSTSTNDLVGLRANTVTLGLGDKVSGTPGYDITGDAIKIGTLGVTSAVSPGSPGQDANLLLPLSLQGSETWSVDIEDNSNLNLGAVSGPTADALTVDLPVAGTGNGGGFLGVPSFETGPLGFQGVAGQGSTYVTGASAFNARTLNPVSFTDTSLFETGPGGSTPAAVTVHYGPLSIVGTTVFLGNGSGGPFGIDSVKGNASLDAATHLNLNALEPGTGAAPSAGLSYPQLKATGTVTLGSAALTLFAACGQTLGTTYTVVRAGAVAGTFQNLPDGTVVQSSGDGSAGCSTAPATYLRIRYTATTVTATVVAPPPSAAPSRTMSVLVPHSTGHQVVLAHES